MVNGCGSTIISARTKHSECDHPRQKLYQKLAHNRGAGQPVKLWRIIVGTPIGLAISFAILVVAVGGPDSHFQSKEKVAESESITIARNLDPGQIKATLPSGKEFNWVLYQPLPNDPDRVEEVVSKIRKQEISTENGAVHAILYEGVIWAFAGTDPSDLNFGHALQIRFFLLNSDQVETPAQLAINEFNFFAGSMVDDYIDFTDEPIQVESFSAEEIDGKIHIVGAFPIKLNYAGPNDAHARYGTPIHLNVTFNLLLRPDD